MNITTQFDIGEKVMVKKESRLHHEHDDLVNTGKVIGIKIRLGSKYQLISYYVDFGDGDMDLTREDDLQKVLD